MKLQTKILLIFILFLAFLNKESFGAMDTFTFNVSSTSVTVDMPYSGVNIENIESKSFTIGSGITKHYLIPYHFLIISSSATNVYLYYPIITGSYLNTDFTNRVAFTFNTGNSYLNWLYMPENAANHYITYGATNLPGFVEYKYNFNNNTWEATNSTTYTINKSAFKYLKYATANVYNTYIGSDSISFTGKGAYFPSPLVDKIDLFELNLTDKDNNQQHKFNLATFSDSACYDELMGYYNNDNRYAIYLTDYTADMVYTDNTYTNLSYGSYNISGYIDFLTTDNSFFYYSEYYNKVLSNSGTKIFNKDISNYTKRFYFNIVYSEDSNDTNVEISEYNGNLLLSDDYTEPYKCYFIGSSQTIYYANEKSNHNIKDLSDSIYYLGYIDGENGKVRDISEVPFYVYNFTLGGNYFKRSTGSLGESHNTGGWSGGGRSGEDVPDNSYIIGDDKTTSTYPKDTVTPDTTPDNDSIYIGDDRTPQQEINEDNTSSDTSNWGILDFIKGIFDNISSFVANLLDGFTGLFVPDDDFFSNTFSGLDEWFTGRLGFIFYPFDLTVNIFNRIVNIDFGEPRFEIPDIIEPTTGKKLIASREFNFNDILQNETFANLHEIYLIIVDGIIVFALINLLKNKFGEVMSK